MRPLSIFGGGFAAACLLLPALSEAAILQGRVVDSTGRPVAGAEIRVWRNPPIPGGPYESVSFDGSETIIADAEGRFTTPDVLQLRVRVRMTAQATTMLAGRSGWIVPQQDITEVEDIVLPRLRAIVGQVVDRQGAPQV